MSIEKYDPLNSMGPIPRDVWLQHEVTITSPYHHFSCVTRRKWPSPSLSRTCLEFQSLLCFPHQFWLRFIPPENSHVRGVIRDAQLIQMLSVLAGAKEESPRPAARTSGRYLACTWWMLLSALGRSAWQWCRRAGDFALRFSIKKKSGFCLPGLPSQKWLESFQLHSQGERNQADRLLLLRSQSVPAQSW